jgi:putative FmdB family regulatory protein
MPIYEYQCEACGHKQEKLQKLSDDPLKLCPDCDKPELKKLISSVAFRLKGSGWYETDFKTGDKKNVSSSENSSGASGGSSKSSGGSSKGSGSSSKSSGSSSSASDGSSKSSGSDSSSKSADSSSSKNNSGSSKNSSSSSSSN